MDKNSIEEKLVSKSAYRAWAFTSTKQIKQDKNGVLWQYIKHVGHGAFLVRKVGEVRRELTARDLPLGHTFRNDAANWAGYCDECGCLSHEHQLTQRDSKALADIAQAVHAARKAFEKK